MFRRLYDIVLTSWAGWGADCCLDHYKQFFCGFWGELRRSANTCLYAYIYCRSSKFMKFPLLALDTKISKKKSKIAWGCRREQKGTHPAHDARTTLYGCRYAVKMLKRRRISVVLTSCFGWEVIAFVTFFHFWTVHILNTILSNILVDLSWHKKYN